MAIHRAMYDKLVNLIHFSTVMDVFIPYMCAFQQRVFVGVGVYVCVCSFVWMYVYRGCVQENNYCAKEA